MHSVDSAESPKNWESESPTKTWINHSESSDSESFKQWENSAVASTPPKQWAKRPETPHQKTWIKIPTLMDLNSSRKWETSRTSVSPETQKHAWLPSPQRVAESQKSWLNIPRPDSPKQQWTPKNENAKNWVPINLPKLSNCQKSWVFNPKKTEMEIGSEWATKNLESQPWMANLSEGSKNWVSPNQKRPNSPTWMSSSQKRSESPKTWKGSPTSREEKNWCKKPENDMGWCAKGSNTTEEKDNWGAILKEDTPSPEPASASPTEPAKWPALQENVLDEKSNWTKISDSKRELSNTSLIVKTPVWPK